MKSAKKREKSPQQMSGLERELSFDEHSPLRNKSIKFEIPPPPPLEELVIVPAKNAHSDILNQLLLNQLLSNPIKKKKKGRQKLLLSDYLACNPLSFSNDKILLVSKAVSEVDELKNENYKRASKIFLSNNYITTLEHIKQFKKARVITLAHNEIEDLGELNNLRQCINLKSISLEGNPVSKLPNFRAHVLLNLPMLRELDGIIVSIFESSNAINVINREKVLLQQMLQQSIRISTLFSINVKFKVHKELFKLLYGRQASLNSLTPSFSKPLLSVLTKVVRQSMLYFIDKQEELRLIHSIKLQISYLYYCRRKEDKKWDDFYETYLSLQSKAIINLTNVICSSHDDICYLEDSLNYDNHNYNIHVSNVDDYSLASNHLNESMLFDQGKKEAESIQLLHLKSKERNKESNKENINVDTNNSNKEKEIENDSDISSIKDINAVKQRYNILKREILHREKLENKLREVNVALLKKAKEFQNVNVANVSEAKEEIMLLSQALENSTIKERNISAELMSLKEEIEAKQKQEFERKTKERQSEINLKELSNKISYLIKENEEKTRLLKDREEEEERTIKEQQNKENFFRIKKYFKYWRGKGLEELKFEKREEKLIKIFYDFHLLKASLRKWKVFITKLKTDGAFEGLIDLFKFKHYCRIVLRNWLFISQKNNQNFHEAEKVADLRNVNLICKRAFSRWQEFTIQRLRKQKNAKIADEKRKKSLKKRCFSSLNIYKLRRKKKKVMKKHALIFFMRQNFLKMRFMIYLKIEKRDRISFLFRFLRKYVLKFHLKQWNCEKEIIKELEKRCQNFFKEKQNVKVEKFFSKWKIFKITRYLKKLALAKNKARLLKLHLNQWKEYSIFQSSLKYYLDRVFNLVIYKLMRIHFNKWFTKIKFEINYNELVEESLIKRSDERKNHCFAIWKESINFLLVKTKFKNKIEISNLKESEARLKERLHAQDSVNTEIIRLSNLLEKKIMQNNALESELSVLIKEKEVNLHEREKKHEERGVEKQEFVICKVKLKTITKENEDLRKRNSELEIKFSNLEIESEKQLTSLIKMCDQFKNMLKQKLEISERKEKEISDSLQKICFLENKSKALEGKLIEIQNENKDEIEFLRNLASSLSVKDEINKRKIFELLSILKEKNENFKGKENKRNLVNDEKIMSKEHGYRSELVNSIIDLSNKHR